METYRAQNLARAAERLCVTASAASMSISQLEAEAGAQLFERTPRGLKPTPAARAVIDLAERALHDIAQFEAAFERGGASPHVQLSVAATQGLAYFVMPSVLNEFARLSSGTRVDIYDCSSEGIVASIVNAKADFGVGTFEADALHLDIDPILTDSIHAIFRSDSPLASREQIDWDDLMNFPLIVARYSASAGVRKLIDDALVRSGRRFSPAHEVSSINTAFSMVSHGFGVAVYPPLLMRFLQPAGLVSRPITNPSIERSIGIARRRGTVLPGEATLLIALIGRELASLHKACEQNWSSFAPSVSISQPI